ncbi:MAG: ATP-binding protein, partial [Cyanobacteriota bacterium]|nr:ATP-binding protein [Cyanobacteriota bacterium]
TEYRGVALCSFNGYVRLWKESVKETIDSLLLAYYSSLESGEIIHSGYAILNYCTNSFLAGESLDAVEEKHNLYIEELEKQKLNYHVVYGKIGRQLILNLMGKAENPLEMTGEAFQESEIIPLLVEQNNGTSLYYVYLAKAILCYLFAQPKKAIAHLKAAENYLTTVSGLFISAQYNFYQSLAILALYPYQEKAEQYNSIIKITANQEKMENWAYHAPMNFQHKYDLIAAEKSRVLGKRIQAIELYEIAISGAKDNEYLHEEALANELAAKFYLDWDKEKIAATYMQEAYQCYARWGSLAKIEDLEKRYPKLLLSLLQKQSRDLELNKTQFQNLNQSSFNKTITITHSNSSSISENLDLASILKASQALSSEIHLEQLISKLMQVIMENAGAKKAALILLEEDTLMLKAVANNSQNIELLDLPCHHSKEIPNTVINYVKRSLKTAVFDNAIKNPDFIGDSYLIEQKSKSLLCMPILNQGQLIGLLYLENNLTIGAFTKNRLDIINLLVTQAAFSLKNAQLYAKLEDYSHTLEQKVELRTQEATQRAIQLESTLKKLQRSQAQLIQTEKMSGLAQVVAGVAHEINNPINFISANLTPASEYVQSLIELISLQQNLSSQPLPKVEAKIAEIELDYLIEDLPKLLTSMETGATRIKEIVLSLRNFSRLDEAEIKFVDIHQGIDSTLLILQHQLNSNVKYPAIEVIKKYSQLPKISCYASQLNQVFLNIINNAIYALRDKQEKQPAITITTLLKNKGRISISIKDNGMGINQSVVDKIFDPFFTTKPVGSGTGLGLSTSYSIVVKKHNGKLSCNSILGEETEFILELPINSEQRAVDCI